MKFLEKAKKLMVNYYKILKLTLKELNANFPKIIKEQNPDVLEELDQLFELLVVENRRLRELNSVKNNPQ